MLVHLSKLSLSLWITTLAAQAALVWVVRKSQTRHTAFAWYSYLYFSGAIAAFVVAATLPRLWYWYAYLLVTIAGDLLILFVALETYSMVFGPATALPRLVMEKTRVMTGAAFTLAIAIGAVLNVVNGGLMMRYLIKVEQIMSVAAWAVFIILLVYSRNLRIAWPRRNAGIVVGYVLCLTINIGAVFFRALGNTKTAAIAVGMGQFSYLVSLIWWTRLFWEKELAFTELTGDQTAFMKSHFVRSMEALQRRGVQVEAER